MWLFHPESVVRWKPKQCSGLLHLGLYVPPRVEDEHAAKLFVSAVSKDMARRNHLLNWAAASLASHTDTLSYPYSTFIYDRMIYFEGLNEWTKRRVIMSLMQDAMMIEWFKQAQREFSVAHPSAA
jgi:hypothetical protein